MQASDLLSTHGVLSRLTVLAVCLAFGSFAVANEKARSPGSDILASLKKEAAEEWSAELVWARFVEHLEKLDRCDLLPGDVITEEIVTEEDVTEEDVTEEDVTEEDVTEEEDPTEEIVTEEENATEEDDQREERSRDDERQRTSPIAAFRSFSRHGRFCATLVSSDSTMRRR